MLFALKGRDRARAPRRDARASAAEGSMFDAFSEVFSGVEGAGGSVPRDEELVSLIAAGTVDVGPADIELDGRYRRYIAVRDFPYENSAGFLDRLKSVPGSRLAISVKPADASALRKSVDHTTARAGVNLISAGSASKHMDNEIDRMQAESVMAMMAGEQKQFVTVAVTLAMESEDAEELAFDWRHLRDSVKPAGLTLDPLSHAQGRALRRCNPVVGAADPYLDPKFMVDMPAETLAASLPFDSGGILDADGTVLGRDRSHAMVRVDMLRPTPGRANMNITVTGKSGNGKSHLLKAIAMDEYARAGARVIWLDFEQEAKFACKRVAGQYINMGSGGARCCPTQYRALNFDFDDDGEHGKETSVIDVLRSTISFLDGFYQLAFGLGNDEMPYLERGLIEAYKRHGVTLDTPWDAVDFEDYPSFDEIASVFRELSAEAADKPAAEAFSRLAAHSERGGASGVYGNLWSGTTNISLTGDFIAFDLSALTNMPDAVRNAQMYSVLSFVWSEVCRSRVTGKPLRLIVDEAHLLFGGGTVTDSASASPIAASLLSNICRRARKYSCGLAVATQALQDFCAPGVRQFSEAIFSNSTYLFAFGTPDTQSVTDMLKIPPEKADDLADYGKGQCIFRAGAETTFLQVTPATALQGWLGRAGGR